MSESVELATILLTDLVGSTRLAMTVGPARADELREEHFDLLRDAIASSGGKEVKNTGDGLMVAFQSASGAVKCAVAMQQRFERRYRRAEQVLHIRIGLGAGESTRKDGDYFGLPSIEAARLCAQAPSDGILVSAAVKMLAGRCEGIELHSAGEFELKGFEESVQAFSVSWAPLEEEIGGASRWPLPALLRSVPPVSYAGRGEERAAMEEAMKLARSGQRQLVLLSGEPGIGKTRLASYAAHHAHAEGFAVCWGTCSEEFSVPYEPWIGVCSQLVEHAPEELVQRHVDRHGGELSRLVRGLARRVPELPEPQSSDSETERYLLFNAVAGLLAEAAEVVPLCVVLDDLHWADAQSVAMLKHLMRTAEQRSLQAIATYRDSDLGKDHPLTAVLADLRPLQGVQRIALHGLGADDVAEIMAAVAGHELEADGLELAAEIAAETDGNPFFVGEILRGLSESGALVFDESSARWSIDTSSGIALPESVREVIERRVQRLGDEKLEALRVASVIGHEFDLELLSATLETDEARVLDNLEAAVAASVLAESSEHVGRFRFAHGLINETLYDGLGPTRRARTHQRVAEALEHLYGQDPGERLAEFALHWRLAAVSVDRAKAADYALKAGERALDSLAPAEAVKLFADAVELAGGLDTRERCEALTGLGEAQRQTGDADYRETLLEASRLAAALGDSSLAARAALENNRGYSSVTGEVDEQRLQAIQQAIVLDDPPDPARRARLLALQAQELAWDADLRRRVTLADEAVALARTTGDPRTLSEVLRAAIFAYWSPETLQLRTGLCQELLEHAAVDPALQQWSQDIAGHVYSERGEFGRAEEAFARQRKIAEELGQPTLTWFARFPSAGYAFMRGELQEAEQLAEQAMQAGQEAEEPDAIMFYASVVSSICTCQGRGQEMVELVQQSVDAFPALAAWRAGLAWILCWSDRRDEAAAILKDASVDGFEHVPHDRGTLTALALYSDVAFETEDAAAARLLRGLIEPYADQYVWNALAGYGHARMSLGLVAAVLGEHERSDEHLSFACEFHEANRLALWTARAHLGWAEALARRGDCSSAQVHASRALELSRDGGYGAFERRAAALVTTESTAGA